MGKRFKGEEIVRKVREIELAMNKGMDVQQAGRQAGISEQSYRGNRKSAKSGAVKSRTSGYSEEMEPVILMETAIAFSDID